MSRSEIIVHKAFHDITLEKLTPDQLELLTNETKKHDLSIDDVLLYLRMSTSAETLSYKMKVS